MKTSVKTPAFRQRLYFLLLLLLVAGGFTLRLNWFLQKDGREIVRIAEEGYYLSTAVNAFVGKGFEPEGNFEPDAAVFVPPPAQSFVLLTWFRVCGRVTSMFGFKLLQIFISALGIFLAADIGKKIAGRWGGLAFAGLFAFYPDFVFWPAYVATESNYLIGLLGFLWLLLKWLEKPGTISAAALAVMLGGLHLMRPNGFFLGPLLAVFLVQTFSWKKARVWAVIWITVPYLVLVPWMLHNVQKHDDAVWVSSNGGILFYFVNRLEYNPLREPYYEQVAFGPHADRLYDPGVDAKNSRGETTYHRMSKHYFAKSFAYMGHHPLHFMKNVFIRTWNQFVLPQEITRVALPGVFASAYFFLLVHRLLLATGLFGVAVALLTKPNLKTRALLWIFGYYTVFAALFHLTGDGRMNLFLKLFLAIFSAMACRFILRNNAHEST